MTSMAVQRASIDSPGTAAVSAITPNDLSRVFDLQRRAFARSHPPSLKERRATLATLARVVDENRMALIDAAQHDFGVRSPFETELSEVIGTTSSIRYLQSRLRSWMRPRRRSASIWFMPAKNQIEVSPLGVVGVVAPWNFPVQLGLIPAATALAAGNRVMLKVSEFTPHLSSVLKRIVHESFDAEQFFVTDGDGDVSAAFTKLPFNHLLFTGSTHVGRMVAKAAAENLTPITLELGGKSPVVVDADYSIDRAARNVAWAKLYNGGQVCAAPDYVLVPRGQEQAFAHAVIAHARKMYPAMAGNPSYTAVLNRGHYDRVTRYVEECRSLGAEVMTAENPELGRGSRQLPLIVILNPPADTAVMNEEIFAPILPVVGYDSEEDAIELVKSKGEPLALYVLSSGASRQRLWLDRIPSGGAVVNDMLIGYLQNDLPFGGRGKSGYGAYHAREGFDTMSHLRPVTYQKSIMGRTGVQMLYPPYSRFASVLLKVMRRI